MEEKKVSIELDSYISTYPNSPDLQKHPRDKCDPSSLAKCLRRLLKKHDLCLRTWAACSAVEKVRQSV